MTNRAKLLFPVVLLFGTMPMLNACAGLKGRPEPLVSASELTKVARRFALPDAYETYAEKNGQLARKLYRNELIVAHLAALDARYADFRGQLSLQTKSSNLAFDSVLLGLAGAGSLSSGAANEIAAATAGVVGLRGAVDRNIYFDKTLPALLAAMDGQRFRIATAIQEKMNRDDEAYPLVAALRDIRAYEDAGTLDEAVTTLSQAAAVERQDAEQQYDREVRYACSPKAELGQAARTLGDFNRRIFRDALTERDGGTGSVTRQNELKKLATYYKVPTTAPLEQIIVGIVGAMNAGFCTVDEINAFKLRLRTDFAPALELSGG